MWLRWFPWRLLVSRAARARGLIDPVKVLMRLESFAQPLEGKIPLELIRAGLVFHARGLLNTGAIQHNLDWIWPYWVERQYDPADDAFIPRAFSITHVNLTHRNWAAIGVPDRDTLPIVDPRGLVTPFRDGWSLDGWIVARDGRRLVPSKLEDAGQHLEMGDGIAVVTRGACDGMELLSRASVRERDGSAECVLSLRARSESDACLVVALRPYNPEGVSFVEEVRLDRQGTGWRVGRRHVVLFDSAPERYAFSDYHAGDVHTRLFDPDGRDGVRCKVGMATAAALYEIGEGERQVLASGILPEWLEADGPISLGPAPTSFGGVRVEILPRGRRAEVRWSGSWRGSPPPVEVRLPGFAPFDAPAGQGSALLTPEVLS